MQRPFPFGISGLDVITVPESEAEARIKRDAAFRNLRHGRVRFQYARLIRLREKQPQRGGAYPAVSQSRERRQMLDIDKVIEIPEIQKSGEGSIGKDGEAPETGLSGDYLPLVRIRAAFVRGESLAEQGFRRGIERRIRFYGC